MRFAFLTVLSFSTEDFVGFGLLILLQFLHVTLLISVCFIKVALGKKCGVIFKKLRAYLGKISTITLKKTGKLKYRKEYSENMV